MNPIVLLILLLLPLATGAVESASGNRLPQPVRAALSYHGLSGEGLSVFIQAVDADAPLLEVNAGTPRRPASVIKLLTTYAALDALGPGYEWKTEAWVTDPVENGVLAGDLVIRGTGDPALSLERFWTFLRDLRRLGVRRIQGDLVLDNTFFEPDEEDPGDFDSQPYRSYNVAPDALLVNFGAVRFDIRRRPDGAIAISPDPPLAGFEIDNQVRSRRGPCGGFQRGVAFDLPKGFAGRRAVFSGRFPTGCTDYSLWRAVLPAPQFAEAVFRALWEEMGGQLEGRMRIGPVPEDATLLHAYSSMPLGEIVHHINKWSNNVMTRQLLLTLGAERYGAPGTREKGRRAINDWLAERGLDADELFLDNGSGLSRKTTISARSLGRILLDAWKHPFMAELMASMPISAIDGTMKRRYPGDMAGRLHLKTGRLDEVASVAGFMMNRDGRRHVVVIIHNDRDAHRGIGEDIQDVILRWVFDQR
jgi:D-alanyl-D-alanine carboxypeptidase/D-alanyl-D-alanine-endopeptidase (penicillin-binding protein 4)